MNAPRRAGTAAAAGALALLALAGCGGGGIAGRAQAQLRERTGNAHLEVSDCVVTSDGLEGGFWKQWSCLVRDPVSGVSRSVTVTDGKSAGLSVEGW
jgi:hypothetical protein